MMLLQQVSILKLKRNLKSSQFADQASFVKCLGDPTCLKILFILSKEKFVCPSDLQGILNISLPAVSHQLSRLKQMGIIENKRMGQMICYSYSYSREAKFVRKLVKSIILPSIRVFAQK